MAIEPVLFKFAVGDLLFLKDTITRASTSVFRVEVTALDGVSGVPRYRVRPKKRKDLRDLAAYLVAEEDLTPEPSAKNLSPAQRARWAYKRAN